MKTSPCKDCKKRHIGCHSECDDYIKFQIVHNIELNTIKKNKDKGRIALSYTIDTIRKQNKRLKRTK